MAIAAILFSLWYADIAKALDTKPKQHKEDNVAACTIVSGILFAKALPVAIMALSIVLIFSPDALKIAKDSMGRYRDLGLSALANYDAVRTAYCFVTILSVVLAVSLWVLVVKLLSLRKELN